MGGALQDRQRRKAEESGQVQLRCGEGKFFRDIQGGLVQSLLS